ncbi:MAG TPA: sigma-E processing peptidase SpoIIGA [Anaerovoracaceae bacterium]|nr:sigma-E processing peptidase SpoIIGA [Anaerovoracaceae bacterium]
MVIYAEYLFLENAVTGGIILLLTGKISGLWCKNRYLVLGSILCGIYSFILFWDSLNPLLAIISKLGFSLAVVYTVFQPKKLRRFARITLVFYLVSFAMGGITIGLMYFVGIAGVTQNSSVYLGALGYLYVLLGCALTYLIFSIFADFIRGRMIKERTYTDVEIVIEGRSVTMKGMVDTGNFLTDPLTGKPVMIISAAAAKQFLPDEIVEEAVREKKTQILSEELMSSNYANRIRMIPYQSIGEERGYLVGIRPDAIRIGIHNRKGSDRAVMASEGAILAIYKGMFSGVQSEGECSILLHPSMIEGGIASDV